MFNSKQLRTIASALTSARAADEGIELVLADLAGKGLDLGGLVTAERIQTAIAAAVEAGNDLGGVRAVVAAAVRDAEEAAVKAVNLGKAEAAATAAKAQADKAKATAAAKVKADKAAAEKAAEIAAAKVQAAKAEAARDWRAEAEVRFQGLAAVKAVDLAAAKAEAFAAFEATAVALGTGEAYRAAKAAKAEAFAAQAEAMKGWNEEARRLKAAAKKAEAERMEAMLVEELKAWGEKLLAVLPGHDVEAKHQALVVGYARRAANEIKAAIGRIGLDGAKARYEAAVAQAEIDAGVFLRAEYSVAVESVKYAYRAKECVKAYARTEGFDGALSRLKGEPAVVAEFFVAWVAAEKAKNEARPAEFRARKAEASNKAVAQDWENSLAVAFNKKEVGFKTTFEEVLGAFRRN